MVYLSHTCAGQRANLPGQQWGRAARWKDQGPSPVQRADDAAGTSSCRPAAPWRVAALRGAGRSRRAGDRFVGRVLSRVGGGETVGARLVGDHLRGLEAYELVQGVGDRAGRPGERFADLVEREGGAGELAQMVLDPALAMQVHTVRSVR